MLKLVARLWALVLCLQGSHVLSEPLEAQFVAPRLAVNLETDKSGLLADLHELLMQQADVSAKLKVLSPARAVHLMELGKVDGYYPAWVPNDFSVDVLYSAPLMRVEFYIFTAPKAAPMSSLADLRDKRLGIVKGYRLKLPLSDVPGLYVSEAVNSFALYSMLESGRVDAVIMSKNELDLLVEQRNLPMLTYSANAMLAHKYLGYALLNNPKGIRLQRQINAAIYQLQQSGALAERFPSLQRYLQ